MHRFNKAQQDTFLPYVEDGTLIFVGATTENPSFEVVSALLSRARVYVLKALTVGGSHRSCCSARWRTRSAGSARSTSQRSLRRWMRSRTRPTAMRGAR